MSHETGNACLFKWKRHAFVREDSQGYRYSFFLNRAYIAGCCPLFEFLPGFLKVLGLLIEVYGRHGQDLAGMEESLVADGGAAGGNILPAVAGRTVHKGGDMDLGSGGLPADIPYVCAAGEEAGGMEEGNQEIIDSLLAIV